MDEARERQLAEALADHMDGKARGADATITLFPELAGELASLDEIERAIEPDAALPERLSGHRILAEIGAGGMGRVFLAMDEALGRKVAIKTLAARQFGADSRCRATSRQLSALRHSRSWLHRARRCHPGRDGDDQRWR